MQTDVCVRLSLHGRHRTWLLAPLAVVAIVLANGAGAAEPVLAAGQESSVTLPPSNGTAKVYLPSNYAAGHKWPVLFFYHGMGGSPETTTMRKFTGGRDYIIVGMPYLEGEKLMRTAEEHAANVRREQANLHLALDWLAANAAVDKSRVFISGVSKGGWMTAALGDVEFPGVAGLIICLAGRRAGSIRALAVPAAKNKPIYVGAGETDPNLVPALTAAEFYRRSGAVVTFEEYAGIGHQVPAAAEKLSAWLQVNCLSRQPTNQLAVRRKWHEEFKGSFDTAMAETNAIAQYRQLRSMSGDPRFNLCARPLVAEVQSRLGALIKSPPARDEWNAEATFNEAVYREATIRKPTDPQAVVEGFRNTAGKYPQTHFGKIAVEYLPQIEQAYGKSVKTTSHANEGRPTGKTTKSSGALKPTFPSDSGSDNRARVPVRKGNIISFKTVGEK